MDVKQVQKRIVENKIRHGFGTSNIEKEFCLLYGEVGEAYMAYLKDEGRSNLGSELADVAIYLFGIAEMLGFDMEQEMLKKMSINESREYVTLENGVKVKK